MAKVAGKFYARGLLRKSFGRWALRRRLSRDAEVLDTEQGQRRSRIQSFLNNIKAKTAAPPAPPNTPVDGGNDGEREAFSANPQPIKPGSAGHTGTDTSRKPHVPRVNRDKLAAAAARRRAQRDVERSAKKDAYLDRERRRDEDREQREQQRELKEAMEEGKLDDISLSERLERQKFLRRQAEERVAKRRAADREEDADRARGEERKFEALKEERRKEVAAQRALQERRQDALLRKDARHQRLVSATRHFRRTNLLVRWGLGPWQQVMAALRESISRADAFRRDRLVQSVWDALAGYFWATKKSKKRREVAQLHLAGAHAKQVLVKSHFRAWILHRRMLKAKAVAVTGAFSRFSHLKRGWKAWGRAQQRALRQEAMQLRTFARKGDLSVLRFFYRKWTKFTDDNQLDREAALRADETWSKVQSWLHK